MASRAPIFNFSGIYFFTLQLLSPKSPLGCSATQGDLAELAHACSCTVALTRRQVGDRRSAEPTWPKKPLPRLGVFFTRYWYPCEVFLLCSFFRLSLATSQGIEHLKSWCCDCEWVLVGWRGELEPYCRYSELSPRGGLGSSRAGAIFSFLSQVTSLAAWQRPYTSHATTFWRTLVLVSI